MHKPSCFEASEWPVKAAAEMKVAEPLVARCDGASRSLTRGSSDCHPDPCLRDGCWPGRGGAAQTWGQRTSQAPRMRLLQFGGLWLGGGRGGRARSQRKSLQLPLPHPPGRSWQRHRERLRCGDLGCTRSWQRACGLDCSSFRACSEGPGCTPLRCVDGGFPHEACQVEPHLSLKLRVNHRISIVVALGTGHLSRETPESHLPASLAPGNS